VGQDPLTEKGAVVLDFKLCGGGWQR
jgi:hypothetical protein